MQHILYAAVLWCVHPSWLWLLLKGRACSLLYVESDREVQLVSPLQLCALLMLCMQVIHNAHSAQVTLSNNKRFEARLQGAEPDKDLAGGWFELCIDDCLE